MTRSGKILVDHDDLVSTITLNRPERLNSLDPDMVIELMDVVREVDLEESTRAIVLTGAGRAFTAGGDVGAFGSKPDPRVHRRGWHLVHRMLEIEKPIVAMINGPAVGLGLTLALLCDSTVMADDATIGDTHVNLGLAAGDGGALVLPILIGPHRAKELLLTGRLVTGVEAAAMGMVNRSVPAAELHDVAYGLAREYAAQPVYAARATKMVVNRYLRWMAGQVLDVSLAYEAISRNLPEYPEAVDAWKRRRAEEREARGVVTASAPLAGLRVVDLGTRIAAPFCAALLGELGADVVKVEDPGTGDLLREIGPFEDDYSLFWAVEGRNKRSVTCDLRVERGQQLVRRLLETADVLCENFRPGTLERWNLGPEQLPPSLVTVRISVFGQEGPSANRPGLDLIALAAGGLLEISGYPDGPPSKSGITVADHLTAVFAAQAALAALHERRRTGRGAVIDVPLHGSVLRVLEWTIAGADRLGTERTRVGTRGPHEPPSGVCTAADGRFVAVAVEHAGHRDALAALVGGPGAEAAGDTDLLEEALAAWVGARPAAVAADGLVAAGVPAAVVATTSDIATDPHLAARGDLVTVDDPVLGPVRQQAPFPRLGDGPSAPLRPAPRLGEHNDEVWGELGVSASERAELRADGVI